MAVVSPKALSFLLLISIFGSLMSDAREVRESVYFGKTTPNQIDTDSDSDITFSSHAIERANKFGQDPNSRQANDDLVTLYSNKIDQEEADEVSDAKLKSESSSFNVNNFEDKIRHRNSYESQRYENKNKNSYNAYPYGVGETHYLNEDRYNRDDDQVQTNENENDDDNLFYQYEGKSEGTTDKPRYTRKHSNNQNEIRKQGMSDTRYLENGKYFYNANKNPYGYSNKNSEVGKQGLTDTQYLENGKYFYNANRNPYSNKNNLVGKQGMSDTRYLENGKYSYNANANANANLYSYEDANNGYKPYQRQNSDYETSEFKSYQRQNRDSDSYYAGYEKGNRFRATNEYDEEIDGENF